MEHTSFWVRLYIRFYMLFVKIRYYNQPASSLSRDSAVVTVKTYEGEFFICYDKIPLEFYTYRFGRLVKHHQIVYNIYAFFDAAMPDCIKQFNNIRLAVHSPLFFDRYENIILKLLIDEYIRMAKNILRHRSE